MKRRNKEKKITNDNSNHKKAARTTNIVEKTKNAKRQNLKCLNPALTLNHFYS